MRVVGTGWAAPASARRFALGKAADPAPCSRADAHVRIAADERAVDRIAHFAPAVLEAASVGDPVAARIVADGVGELVGVLHAAWRAAGSHALTPTVVTGRLAGAMGDRLRTAIDETAGRFDFMPPAGEAIDGGLALAGLATRYGGLVRTWTREAS
jgi:N-acetylglucosamine kinase-like BadF-type ATPase